ncbi:unnamed protein product [Schistosoma rodhaini]|uniref:AraC family transcriptional regulator n=1 Tax=Schistosoma rodhaini TaxID=6188 RepID=A0AA85GDA1_9TREM|nr:unnamed protein product [Schistosoma rodhaini]
MFTDSESLECQRIVSQLYETAMKGLNVYNLYSECAGGVQMSSFNQNRPSMSITELSSILTSSKQFIHHDFGNLFCDNVYIKYRRYAK